MTGAALLALLLAGVAPVADAPAASKTVQQREAVAQKVERMLAEGSQGARFGLVVATLEGEELLAIAPDQRFIPASTTKLFPTIAAFELLDGGSTGGALVRFERSGKGAPDLVLEGRGDGRLSSAPDCVRNCLAALADAVAARTREVGDVIGDARFLPDERWSQGMSWNNIPTSSGTALSALTLDRNEIALRVTPGATGGPPAAEVSSYLAVDNKAVTSDGTNDFEVARLPGSRELRLSGKVKAGSETRLIRLGVDDPAHHAAWRLAAMLRERGVKVSGTVRSRYRAKDETRAEAAGEAVATLDPGPLAEELTTINKSSQNLLAELLLRRVGLVDGDGSAKAGVEAVGSVLGRAGIDRRAVVLADGSGMSTYNRVTPRALVRLLGWAARQPWSSAFRSTLPIGGIDGTLANRFKGTQLRGRVFAKTGSLNATNALAGYLLTSDGRTLVFAFHANDVPEDVRATRLIDEALVLIASEL